MAGHCLGLRRRRVLLNVRLNLTGFTEFRRPAARAPVRCGYAADGRRLEEAGAGTASSSLLPPHSGHGRRNAKPAADWPMMTHPIRRERGPIVPPIRFLGMRSTWATTRNY